VPKPLPCPFCGKLPKILPTNPEVEGTAWAAVVCVNKRCATYDGHDEGVRVSDGALTCDGRGTDAYKAAAIKRWNNRTM